MKRRIILISGALMAIAISIGIIILSTVEAWPLKNAKEAYIYAIDMIHSSESQQLHITIDTEINVSDEILHETSEQTLSVYYQNNALAQAYAEENWQIGDQTITLSEMYYDGSIYIDLNGSKFSGSCPPEVFLSGRAPSILLSPDNYETIEGVTGKAGSIISFSYATAPEKWALPEGSTFIDANGDAKLSPDGALTESNYCITYAIGDQTITKAYTVSPKSPPTEPPALLPDTEKYLKVSDISQLKTLERACGYLLQLTQVSSQYSETISCQAFGDTRTRTVHLNMEGTDPISATIESEVRLQNSSRGEEITTHSQIEDMADGVYTITVDGQISDSPTMDEHTFLTYCRNLLVGTVILPEHIQNIRFRADGDICYLEFDAIDALADSISTDACNRLYQDPQVLNKIATGKQTNVLSACFAYRKSTLLPISSDIHFEGTYTINELPYSLAFKATQTYDVPQ